MLKILAFHTAYSETVNLKLPEIAHILFPGQKLDRDVFDKTRGVLAKNCFVVHRGDGFRISHPLIAKNLLKEVLGETNYSNKLVALAKELVDVLGLLYDCDSPRLDSILHDLFIYREPLSESQRKVFSVFITELDTDKQRIEIMSYVREKFPSNPHYSNHLARLYLKPQDENQWPNIPKAKEFAKEAIKRAEQLPDESVSIHHHLLGKVFARDCVSQYKHDLGRNHISHALNTIAPVYQNAFREFNICSYGKNSAFGLVGKLELINSIFKETESKLTTTISSLLKKEMSIQRKLMKMIAEAGNIIHQYISSLDEWDTAFQSARLDFYKHMGQAENIERVFYTNSQTLPICASSRRATITVLEAKARKSATAFSYSQLDQQDLAKSLSKISRHVQRRIFFRQTSPIFLTIHKVCLVKSSSPGEKISRRWAHREILDRL